MDRGSSEVISRRAKRTSEDGWEKSNNQISEETCESEHVTALVFSWKESREPQAELRKKRHTLNVSCDIPKLQRYREILASFQKENKIFKPFLLIALRLKQLGGANVKHLTSCLLSWLRIGPKDQIEKTLGKQKGAMQEEPLAGEFICS